MAFPNLPCAGVSEADTESTSSLELAETQTVSYAAASTLSPAEPFSMIITNDPQFPWHTADNVRTTAFLENWDKIRAIENIVKKNWYGRWVEKWPDSTLIGSNDYFERSMLNKSVENVIGVIINGDLTFNGFNKNYDLGGWQVFPTHRWTYRDGITGGGRDWFYRNYYVSFLKDRCPDLHVWAGMGNHDTKWAWYDLATALLKPKGFGDRKWINFPDSNEYNYNVDWDPATTTGSLAYSWDIGNYHFVQANLAYNSFGETADYGGKWLGNGVTLTSPLSWLKRDLQKATNEGKRIVVNLHGRYAAVGDLDVEFLMGGKNVVAVFKGHATSSSAHGRIGYVHSSSGGNATNKFGQFIPIFQAGHAWDDDHKLLLVECADDYMNVGLVDCGDKPDPVEDAEWSNELGGVPQWTTVWPKNEKYMCTLKWVNRVPKVTDFVSVSTPVYEGQYTCVAHGNFTDDSIVTSPPRILDSWKIKVNYGDFTQFDYSGDYSFDLEHRYVNDDKYLILVNVTDSEGESGIAQCEVTVLNEDPIVDVSNKTVFKGENFTLTASFSDPGVLDTHTATVEWGDETSDPGTVDEQDGSGTVTASHIYNAPGSYTANVTVNDYDGGSNHKIAHINVIVALSGFVTDEYNNNDPLAGVIITCNGTTTTTDSNGYYEFTPLIPGDHSVNMTIPPGYNSIVPTKTATITAGQETIVNFTAYPLPDIIVTKSTVDAERLAGDTITYQITVENQGDANATNMVINDILPNMTKLISYNPPATIDGQTLTWSIGTLANQSSTTIEVTVRTSLLLYPDTILNNSVTVDFDDWKELPQTPETASATTTLLSTVPTENLQGIGYWRHQVEAFLDGKSCDYTESEWILLFDKIRVSSQIYDFSYSLENVSDIILAKATGKDTMETQARQQLYALWLNLAARAVAADTAVELADLTTTTTVAEALTHCEDMLLDPDRTKTTCECSKDICDCINNCEGLPW